jgi:hypothetical protein
MEPAVPTDSHPKERSRVTDNMQPRVTTLDQDQRMLRREILALYRFVSDLGRKHPWVPIAAPPTRSDKAIDSLRRLHR